MPLGFPFPEQSPEPADATTWELFNGKHTAPLSPPPLVSGGAQDYDFVITVDATGLITATPRPTAPMLTLITGAELGVVVNGCVNQIKNNTTSGKGKIFITAALVEPLGYPQLTGIDLQNVVALLGEGSDSTFINYTGANIVQAIANAGQGVSGLHCDYTTGTVLAGIAGLSHYSYDLSAYGSGGPHTDIVAVQGAFMDGIECIDLEISGSPSPIHAVSGVNIDCADLIIDVGTTGVYLEVPPFTMVTDNSALTAPPYNKVVGLQALVISSPADPLVSGTVYQNPLLYRDVDIYIPVTFSPGGGSAATVVGEIGSANTLGTVLPTVGEPDGEATGGTKSYNIHLPAGWFFKVTVDAGGLAVLNSGTILIAH